MCLTQAGSRGPDQSWTVLTYRTGRGVPTASGQPGGPVTRWLVGLQAAARFPGPELEEKAVIPPS